MTIYKKMNMENKDLERAIYMWFNMKYELYSRLDHNDSIYLYYDGEKYADIRILKKNKYLYFKSGFWKEFSEVFPMELDEFKEFISKWVEDTFNLKGFTPPAFTSSMLVTLKIPLI